MASFDAGPSPAAQAAGGLIRSTGLVAVGVGVTGLGTLVMLAVAARESSPTSFAVIATWWIVATLVAYPLGVFEAFLARHVVTALVERRPPTAAISQVSGRAMLFALAAAGCCSALDPVLTRRVFHGHAGLGFLVGLYVLVAVVGALQRGYATGANRFDVVATQLVGDGIGRAGALTLMVLLRPDDVFLAAAAICGGAAAAVAVAHLRCRGWWARPRLRGNTVAMGPVPWLLVGALGPILINNASVPWLSAAGASAVLIGSFAGALMLSRVPVQLGGAAFGPLLNKISHAVESGDRARQRNLIRRALTAASAVGVVFTAGFTLLGSWVLGLFLGGTYDLPTWVFLLLGASTATMFVAVVVQAEAAARQAWTGIAASWLLAAAAFVLALTVSGPVLERATVSALAASVTGLGALLVVTRRSRRQPQLTRR